MLADYRANGGRIRQKEVCDPFCSAAGGQSRAADALMRPPAKADGEEDKMNKQNDMSWTPKVRTVRTLLTSSASNELSFLVILVIFET